MATLVGYFKSTDGHNGNWSFSCTRLNLHVAEVAARQGGVIIVDATRKGKRFPVSPECWCCWDARLTPPPRGRGRP